MKSMVKKTASLALISLASALNLRAQGYVNFVNTSGTLVQTNESGLGGASGNTAPVNQATYFYALFTAPSTVTTIDSSLQDLMSGAWTFAGLYATNSASAGRLNGGNGVSPGSWAEGVTESYIVVGWSANLGTSWAAIQAQLTGASLIGGVWSGPNIPDAGFLGASSIAQGAASSTGSTGLPLFGGSGITTGFNLYVCTAAPKVRTQPTDQRVPAGQNATFSVAVFGRPPFMYQWQFNGTPILGATNSSYTVPGAQITNIGPYNVVISNSFGSITSASATLSLAYTAVWTNGTSGKWETPSNWVAAFLPASTQSVFVVNTGAKTVTIDGTSASVFSSTMIVSNLTLANPGAASNVLNMISGDTNPPLQVLNGLVLQKGGSLLVGSNSGLQVTGQTTIGDADGPAATGPGLLSVNSRNVTLANTVLGNAGASYGVIDLNDGVLLLTSNLTVAAQPASTGLVSVTSGLLINTNGTQIIGTNGNGTFTQTGGTNQASIITLGGAAGSLGSYTISSATLNAGTLYLGNSAGGLGTLTVQSGTVNIGSNVTLVSGSLSATSSIALNGGSFIATNGLVQVGPEGCGQIRVTGGSLTARQLWLGSSNGLGAGSLYVLGGSVRILGTGIGPGAGFVANWLSVALSGDFDANGTSITIGGDYHNAVASLMDNATAECSTFYVGQSPGFTGTYLQTNNGTMTVSDSMIVGNCVSNATGLVTLSGGTLYVTNASHTAMLDVRNGTFILGSNSTLVVDNLVMTNACGLFMNTGGRLVNTYPPTLWPRIVASTSRGSATLSFQTVATTIYTIEQATNLARPNWIPFATIVGNGSFTNIIVPNGGQTRFFRVQQ